MLTFKLDENLPVEAASVLRDADYDAVTVVEQQMTGEADSKVSSVCKGEDRVLVTFDLDFADIRVYPPHEHSGIIVLRLARQDKPRVLDALRKLVPALQEESLKGFLWIVDEKRIRVRG